MALPELIDSTPYVSGDVLLRVYAVDKFYPHVMRLDITSPFDDLTVAAENPGDYIGWLADLAGVVRIGYQERPNGDARVQHRWKKEDPWQPLTLPRRATVKAFNAAGDMIFVNYPQKQGVAALQAFDLRKGQLIGEPITDPIYDLTGNALRDSESHEIVGFSYNADKPKFRWFDPEYAQLHAAITKSQPGLYHWFHGVTAGHELLVSSGSDVQPEYHWLIDLKTLKGRMIKHSRPWLKPDDLQPMLAVDFPARDGTTLHGYVVNPAGPPRPHPLILIIHGGPATRDIWGFDSEAQYFAALGYAVMQVNYRGSTGYGEDYALENNSMADVLRLSVDDVADAAQWAVTSGLTESKRVAVYGGSFGGYIALGCATRYPDRFACALGFAGVYDWETQFGRDRKEAGSYFKWQKEWWGDHPEKFRPYSPVLAAAAVRCPIWLAHGGADQRVFIEQTQMMAAALKKAGKDFEVHTDTWGVHGLPNPETRKEYYHSVTAFLTKHLPVK